MAERDGCVVDTLPLARLLHEWCAAWERSRPLLVGSRNGHAGEVPCVTAIGWLAQESGVCATSFSG